MQNQPSPGHGLICTHQNQRSQFCTLPRDRSPLQPPASPWSTPGTARRALPLGAGRRHQACFFAAARFGGFFAAAIRAGSSQGIDRLVGLLRDFLAFGTSLVGAGLCRQGEANLYPPADRRSDAPEHRERVAVVVSVLKPADDRGRGSDSLRERTLGQAGLGAKFVDVGGYCRVRLSLLVRGDPLGVVANVAIIEVSTAFESGRGMLFLSVERVLAGIRANFFFRASASAISFKWSYAIC